MTKFCGHLKKDEQFRMEYIYMEKIILENNIELFSVILF